MHTDWYYQFGTDTDTVMVVTISIWFTHEPHLHDIKEVIVDLRLMFKLQLDLVKKGKCIFEFQPLEGGRPWWEECKSNTETQKPFAVAIHCFPLGAKLSTGFKVACPSKGGAQWLSGISEQHRKLEFYNMQTCSSQSTTKCDIWRKEKWCLVYLQPNFLLNSKVKTLYCRMSSLRTSKIAALWQSCTRQQLLALL